MIIINDQLTKCLNFLRGDECKRGANYTVFIPRGLNSSEKCLYLNSVNYSVAHNNFSNFSLISIYCVHLSNFKNDFFF